VKAVVRIGPTALVPVRLSRLSCGDRLGATPSGSRDVAGRQRPCLPGRSCVEERSSRTGDPRLATARSSDLPCESELPGGRGGPDHDHPTSTRPSEQLACSLENGVSGASLGAGGVRRLRSPTRPG
jgi:hypothetical protein